MENRHVKGMSTAVADKKAFRASVLPKKEVRFTALPDRIVAAYSAAPPASKKKGTTKKSTAVKVERIDDDDMKELDISARRKTTKMSCFSTSTRKSSPARRFPKFTGPRLGERQQQLVNEIKKGKKSLIAGQGQDTIEISLVLDVTASMGSWVDKAKETINEIIDKVVKDSEEEGKVNVKVSFIGYTDHSES